MSRAFVQADRLWLMRSLARKTPATILLHLWYASIAICLRRTRMDTEIETELSMVVRYFMRFGAKGGREGLTLQVRKTDRHTFARKTNDLWGNRKG